MKTLNSEWIKLRTTASLWWTTALFIVFACGLAVLTAVSVKALREGDDPVPIPMGVSDVTSGIASVGVTIVIIQATMVITSEYRHNYISMTFQSTPNRIAVALTKLLLYSLYTVVLTLLCTLGALVIGRVLYGGADYKLFDDSAVRILWVLPLYAVLVVLLTMGFAWIVRQTAGAISLMLVWFLALENILGFIPKIGVYVNKYAPFSNLNAFLNQSDIPDLAWGHVGSLFYFIGWAVAIFGLGMVMLKTRDA